MRDVDDPSRGDPQEQSGATQLEMNVALVFGLERRNDRLGFVEHCARVSALVRRMADAFSLDDTELEDLYAAAQLHEIGMISVPVELVESPAELDEISLARLRAQAAIGAEILRATHSPRVCSIVESQYRNFDEIRLKHIPGSREVLLDGIFRAADALDTMQHPRPYQANLDPALSARVLHDGTGTTFHPQAVESLRELRVIN